MNFLDHLLDLKGFDYSESILRRINCYKSVLIVRVAYIIFLVSLFSGISLDILKFFLKIVESVISLYFF